VRTLEDIRTELAIAREKRDQIADDLERIRATGGDDHGSSERRENLETGLSKVDREIEELRDEISEGLAEGLRLGILATDSGEGPDPREALNRGRRDGSDPRLRRDRDGGLRAIERHKDILSSEAGDRLEEVVRNRDPRGIGARYLDAVADDSYTSAFGKLVADPMTGHLRFSPREVEAVRRVSAVQEERTALAVDAGAQGQFAIPFTLDPSVLLSSAGVISPIRQIARSESIVTDVWKGVSSAGITAGFAAEATEASDNAPVLAQPTVDTAKAFAFVPFSIEIGQDWNSLQSEMARLFADAKNVLEATAFLTGTGTDQPKGVLTGLTTTQRVQTATTNVYALADVYSLKQALPARFVSGASWTQHPGNLDRAFRFVGGNSTEPIFYPTRDGRILGIPTYEWSTMTSTMATTNKVAIYGDFSNFLIADRLGGTIELIPHLFGVTNRFPMGQRGLYYYWRVGSDVLVQNAFRYLEVL
jgi:HK97 family phage major capsid protein